MGKFEKLVVLAVLFTAALVLALALNRGGDEVEASDPLSGARHVLDLGAEVDGAARSPAAEVQSDGAALHAPGETPSQGPLSAGASRGASGEVFGSESHDAGQAPSLLLNAGAEDEAASYDSGLRADPAESALALEPQSDPTKRILVDTQGLRPSFLEDYRMYTLEEGDTWSSLAQRFYQDGRYTRNLHLANEDLEELTPGKDILVPVFDFIAVDAGLRPGAVAFEPTQARTDERAPAMSLSTSVRTQPAADSARSAKLPEYEVRSGDTLSDISLAVFGTATRWQEILEANRDKLQRPESLQVGMKLKIPAGGQLPASVKKTETKPKPKPAERADKSDKTAATSKKKKVL